MTDNDLRDQFAMAVLAGALTRYQYDSVASIADQAYDIADAMVAERAARIMVERLAPTVVPGPGAPRDGYIAGKHPFSCGADCKECPL